MLLGPYRAAEGAVADNQMATRTAGRALLAAVAACSVSCAVVLGLSLPAGPLVESLSQGLSVGAVPSNPPLERTAGSPPLAAAAQRERSTHSGPIDGNSSAWKDRP